MENQPSEQPAEQAPQGQASGTFDPPEKCPNCGATLKDAGPVSNTCPHCGHDLESQGQRGTQNQGGQ